ncbi:MAG: TonB-dependent receptor [Acidobacteria bacterium]|nr:TonB-dependent receptor [Acidobacteriota bacterium]
MRGNQSWKFGANLLQQRLKTIPLFGASGGRYEFNRNRTLTNNNGQGAGTGGIEFAQFLLGVPGLTTLREVLIPYYYQWNSAAGFVQNSWKVKPNLTLELGMRYSLQLPRTEKYNNQGTFLPELAREVPFPQPCGQPCILPDGRVITSALVIPFGYSGRGGRSRYIFPVEKNGFEPRFGFAWLPKLFGINDSGRLVIRGGYGLYHAPLTGSNRNPSPDFASGTTGFGTFDTRVENPGTNIAMRICCNRPVLSPQTPAQFLNIPEDGLLFLPGINIAASAVSPNAHIPYMQSWSASVSYEVLRNTVIEFSYRGAKGTHLFLPPTNLNPLPADVTEAFLSRGLNPFAPNVNDPLGRTTPTGAVRQFGPAYIGAKYLGFGILNMEYDSSANSIYQAGSVSVDRRLNRGLSLTANYTFAKSIDDASDSGDVRFVNSNVRSPGYVNLGAPRSLDRSVSLFDIKHAFSATFLYDLPFGRGRSFLSHAPRVVEGMLGGWSLSGVGRMQSGLPMVVVLRDDNGLGILNGNLRTIRPDLVQGVPLINPRWSRNCPIGQLCEPYYNPAAFMRPIKGELGTAPRTFDNARGPAQQFFDLSVQKNFPIGKDGKRRLQLRVDAINVLNHPIFRTGTLEDAGEIFAAPNEANISNAEYDAWAAAAPGRPLRSTPAGAQQLVQINGILIANRIPNTQSIRPDFFHVRVPEGFFSMNANSFDITTLEGLQLYRLRQSYTPDRWGFLNITPERSGYSPRFIQVALKFYF